MAKRKQEINRLETIRLRLQTKLNEIKEKLSKPLSEKDYIEFTREFNAINHKIFTNQQQQKRQKYNGLSR